MVSLMPTTTRGTHVFRGTQPTACTSQNTRMIGTSQTAGDHNMGGTLPGTPPAYPIGDPPQPSIDASSDISLQHLLKTIQQYTGSDAHPNIHPNLLPHTPSTSGNRGGAGITSRS